jgi:hypothetical protein
VLKAKKIEVMLIVKIRMRPPIQESAATLASDSTHARSRPTEGIYDEAYEDVSGENGEGVYSDEDEQNSVNDELDENYFTSGSGDFGSGVDHLMHLVRRDTQWTIKRCFSLIFIAFYSYYC